MSFFSLLAVVVVVLVLALGAVVLGNRMGMSLFGLLVVVGGVLVLGAVVLWRSFRRSLRSQAARFGYTTVAAYLQSPPHTDEEKRVAVDLALKGLVICLAGILVPPLILVGLFPLFYGGRKMAYASMGLGLVDDTDAKG
jgi:hypothetical protein